MSGLHVVTFLVGIIAGAFLYMSGMLSWVPGFGKRG